MAAQIGREAFQAALPDVSSTVNLDGLDQPVEVFRDRYGIPHIRAATTHDAFFAQGFVHGQDRLWKMEFDRRRAVRVFDPAASSAPTHRFGRASNARFPLAERLLIAEID